MQTENISFKIKIILVMAVTLWASAFVGIRAGLESYSPGCLALLRFSVAAVCMLFIFLMRKREVNIHWRDAISLMFIGAIGLGVYNYTLNYGEISVPSGPASFIICQSPVISTLMALIILGERLNILRVFGMLVSVCGVMLIAFTLNQGFTLTLGMINILIATIVGSLYTIMQKPYLAKYHAIDATAFTIWGGAISLLFFLPSLPQEFMHASRSATLAVVYLGIFPAALAYVLWAYALAKTPASRAVSFLYFSPIITTLLGWTWLHEIPVILSLLGGLVALMGVWVVNRSYS